MWERDFCVWEYFLYEIEDMIDLSQILRQDIYREIFPFLLSDKNWTRKIL